MTLKQPVDLHILMSRLSCSGCDIRVKSGNPEQSNYSSLRPAGKTGNASHRSSFCALALLNKNAKVIYSLWSILQTCPTCIIYLYFTPSSSRIPVNVTHLAFESNSWQRWRRTVGMQLFQKMIKQKTSEVKILLRALKPWSYNKTGT